MEEQAPYKMNNDWRELYRDKRKLFVVVSIVVPFLVYCGYYYALMIKNSAYRSDQFQYLVYSKKISGKLVESLDTRSGTFTYLNRGDSLITRRVSVSREALKSLHFTMMDILFWNVRTVSGDSTGKYQPETPLFYISAVYSGKTKTVWWQPHYFEDRKLEDRMEELVRTIHAMAIKSIK